MSLSRMTLSRITLSRITLSRMTFSRITLNITTLSRMTFSRCRMTLSIISFIRMPQSKMILSRMTLNTTIWKFRDLNAWSNYYGLIVHPKVNLTLLFGANVIWQSVVWPIVTASVEERRIVGFDHETKKSITKTSIGTPFKTVLSLAQNKLERLSQEYSRGKYHFTVDLLFDWIGLVCFANKNKNCQLSYS